MPAFSSQGPLLDFQALRPRLIWAHHRAVEERFREIFALSSASETVAWYLERGAVEVRHPGEMARARAGEWIFLRGEDGHQRFTAGSRVISLRFQLVFRGGQPLFPRPRNRVFGGAEARALATVARRLVAAFRRVGTVGALSGAREQLGLVENLRIEESFMAWLAAYTEAMLRLDEAPTVPVNRDGRVAKALRLIEDHPPREKFSEGEIARQCGLSVNQLGRLFRTELQLSPFQYYDKCRLDSARFLLAESAMAVKEMAFELGFSSPPHFSTWFSQQMGTSPRMWRDNLPSVR